MTTCINFFGSGCANKISFECRCVGRIVCLILFVGFNVFYTVGCHG